MSTKVFFLCFLCCLPDHSILVFLHIQITFITVSADGTGDLAKVLTKVPIALLTNICPANVTNTCTRILENEEGLSEVQGGQLPHDIPTNASEFVTSIRFHKRDTAHWALYTFLLAPLVSEFGGIDTTRFTAFAIALSTYVLILSSSFS